MYFTFFGIIEFELRILPSSEVQKSKNTLFDLIKSWWRLFVLVCGDYPADIAFLIDSSGSEFGAQFDNERNFVSMVTNEFAINPNDTMVAVSQFATTSRTDILFNQYPDKDSLLNAIARIQWMNGESNTHTGLNELAHHVFQVKSHNIHHGHHGHQAVTYGPRSESAKIAIVLTDGRSLEPDQTIRAAHQLHNMGVEVFVIGMGHSVDFRELQQIATDRDHVYRISSTNDLAAIHTNIVDAICKCMSNKFCSCTSFLAETYTEWHINGFKTNSL